MIETPCRLDPAAPPPDISQLYAGPRPTSITLLDIIHGGPRRWSQVYLANVAEWDGAFSESQTPSSLVLKLYVSSELDSLEDWDPYESDHLGSDPHESQKRMARLESEAYPLLVGCPVTPRWYGTYEVSVHCLSQRASNEPTNMSVVYIA